MHHAKTIGFAHVDVENLQQPHLQLTWRADFLAKIRAVMIVGYYNRETRACTISFETQNFLQLLPKSPFSPRKATNAPREPLPLRLRVQGCFQIAFARDRPSTCVRRFFCDALSLSGLATSARWKRCHRQAHCRRSQMLRHRQHELFAMKP